MPTVNAGALAELLGGHLEGHPEVVLTGVEDLRRAGPEHVAFASNPRYRKHLATTRAGCVLVDASEQAPGRTLIRLADPYLAFARALAFFHPAPPVEPGVDPRAAVHPEAHVHPTARVEPFAVVGRGARIGPSTWLHAGSYVGPGAAVGRDCRLLPGSVVMDGCVLGDRVWLNPGAVVGGEGFGFAPSSNGLVKIPQAGRAVLGDDVELGANTCVDRAALGETRIGAGTKADNLVQVGHAAEVGPHNVLVAFAGVAGSARTGRGVTLAARAGVLGHLEVGDGVTVASHGCITRDTPAGETVAGMPAIPVGRWRRIQAALRDLPELVKQVRALQARVAELEGRGEPQGP